MFLNKTDASFVAFFQDSFAEMNLFDVYQSEKNGNIRGFDYSRLYFYIDLSWVEAIEQNISSYTQYLKIHNSTQSYTHQSLFNYQRFNESYESYSARQFGTTY